MPQLRLTNREQQVLRYLQTGTSNKDIAESLGIGEQAVKALVSRLLLKFGVSNRTTLAAEASRFHGGGTQMRHLESAVATSRDLRERNARLMSDLQDEMQAFGKTPGRAATAAKDAKRATAGAAINVAPGRAGVATLRQRVAELLEANGLLADANELLSRQNDELRRLNEVLHSRDDDVHAAADEVDAFNKELGLANEQLRTITQTLFHLLSDHAAAHKTKEPRGGTPAGL